jgi:hypothetical protein
VLGVMTPLSTAANDVIGLNVDAVGYPDAIARLVSGAPVSSETRLS